MRTASASRRDRRRLVIGGLILLAIVVVLLRSWPLIPRQLRILSGPEGSTNHTDALAYADYMQRHGVAVEVVETSGAFENLQILASKPDERTIGLSQTGLESLLEGFDPEGLVSLGSVRATPFWLFVRRDQQIDGADDLEHLAGRLIVPGEPGSALRAFVRLLLEENGLPLDILASPRATIRPEDALRALESGEADAAFVFGAPGLPIIDAFLESPLVRPVSLDRAEAYDRRYDRIGVVTLPEGAFDLARNIPSEDVTMLAAADQIVAPEELSAMLVDLVLDAASEVHRNATLLTRRGRFPGAEIVSLPVSAAAERFFRQGPSPLRRWLPYWAATLLDRFWLSAAVIFAGVKLLRVGLDLPFWLTRRRVYRRLEAVEKALRGEPDRPALLEELRALSADTDATYVLRSSLPDYFELRQSIHDVRDRVTSLAEPSTAGSAPPEGRERIPREEAGRAGEI